MRLLHPAFISSSRALRTTFSTLLIVSAAVMSATSTVQAQTRSPEASEALGGDSEDSASTPETLSPTPATTPATTLSATPAPSATPKATPTPKTAPKATPTPKPTKKSQKESNDPLASDMRDQCKRHYPGQIQGELRAACTTASKDLEAYGKALVQTRCRLNYGELPRLVMACLVGSGIADDLKNSRTAFKRKLQLCAEQYPVHTEIDAFLQESCLAGAHLPNLMDVIGKSRADVCLQITPERSFTGPCAVGLSLALESDPKIPPGKQNLLCGEYFDHRQFHAGYRACLSARGLAPDLDGKYGDALQSCSSVTDNNNDTERAACMVGLSIYRHLLRQEDIGARFKKCGDGKKVSFEDRDYLACLAAASLLDFTNKGGAESGCKEIFKSAKNRGRSDCLRSISLF